MCIMQWLKYLDAEEYSLRALSTCFAISSIAATAFSSAIPPARILTGRSDANLHGSLNVARASANSGVIVQMFEWTWDSIAAECTSFLGPAGYGYVQASPAQEHVTGDQWWTDYQPVSYNLTSKRGHRDQYKKMIDACHAAGVKIIADTLWNHMSGSDSGTGIGGTTFTHYDYPGIYDATNFHYCGTPGNDIDDYDNSTQVWFCELDNLADLATEQEYVRARLAAYGNDLLSLGVDGFRLDAAKDILPDDIANITSRLSSAPYITQEVVWGNGQPVQPSDYASIGDVQEFRYTSALQEAFLSGDISSLQDLDNRGWVAGAGANVFVSNHDTERSNSSLNANSPSNAYILALIFSLAHPYGRPSVLSSYTGYWNTDAGSPNGGAGTCDGSGGANGWLCQHRWTPVAGMVGFRNAVGDASLAQWVSPSPQQIAFGRGSQGFVAINNADSEWNTTFQTSLPAGQYCDVISGASRSGICSGFALTVTSGGALAATIPARSAVAIHVGALGAPSGTGAHSASIPLMLSVSATTTFGENLFVTGSLAELGSWSPSASIPLSAARYPLWQATMLVPAGTTFEWKVLRKEADGSVIWEADPNRNTTTPGVGTLGVNTSWQ